MLKYVNQFVESIEFCLKTTLAGSTLPVIGRMRTAMVTG